jgi:hypothetical protein
MTDKKFLEGFLSKEEGVGSGLQFCNLGRQGRKLRGEDRL